VPHGEGGMRGQARAQASRPGIERREYRARGDGRERLGLLLGEGGEGKGEGHQSSL